MTERVAGALIGRHAELAAGERFLEDAAAAPAVLAIDGPAGIGKTTLWEALLSAAERRSYCVLQCRAAESEVQLSFAGLSDLLGDRTPEFLAALPDPLRAALAAVLFHRTGGPRVDVRTLGTAVLRSLDRLSTTNPVILAVDDIQWLDRPSARVLEFAVRRLRRQPLGILTTSRSTGMSALTAAFSPDRLLPAERVRRLSLAPLTLGALHRLVADRFGESLSRPAITRLEEASAGNPLLALEIVATLRRAGRPVTFDEMLPVPTDIGQLVARRMAGLADDSRPVLLTVAALGGPSLDLLQRALPLTRDLDRVLTSATDAGLLVTRGGRARFVHPLFASAVYASASHTERRELHRHLALLLPGTEERARHLALATVAPSASVSRILAEAAHEAASRGALDTAAELLEQARRLTPADDATAEARRTLALAQRLWEVGEVTRSRSLVSDLVARLPPGRQRANASLLLAVQTSWEEGPDAAIAVCVAALPDAAGDPVLRAALHLRAAYCADSDLTLWVEHADAAVRLLDRPDAPARDLLACALLLRAEARLLAGLPFDEADARRAATLVPPQSDVPTLDLAFNAHGVARERLWLLMLETDQLEAARVALLDLHRHDQERGLERAAPIALADLAELDCRLGDPAAASIRANACEELAEQTGRTPYGLCAARFAAAVVAAHTGDLDAARQAAREGEAIAAMMAGDPLVTRLRALAGFVELSDGRWDVAARQLGSVARDVEATGIRLPSIYHFRGDEIEALVRAGELEAARLRLAALERDGQAMRGPWLLAIGGRCRSLLRAADGDTAAALEAIDEALPHHARRAVPIELGRSLLLKGQLHRRRKEKRAAAASLGEARAVFERIGARTWLGLAELELARVGLRPSAPDELTATERQVAILAASGRTNRQVAEALVLSPKTIDGVLMRVYHKLGIRSRAELGARMAERAPQNRNQ